MEAVEHPLLAVLQKLSTGELPQCATSSLLGFINLHLPQLLASLIYDAILDLCLFESIAFTASFLIGVTYLCSYDFEKFKLLTAFIGSSLLLVLPCRMCERMRANISMVLYTITIFGLACYVNIPNTQDASRSYDMEKPENWRLLALAYMNFVAYSTQIVNHPQQGGFLHYFSWHFLGYMFNPTNLIHGPWLSMDTFDRLYTQKQRMISYSVPLWTRHRAWSIMKYILVSFTYYSIGVCVLSAIIEQTETLWCLVFFKCLRCRFMHYSTCYICSASLTCAGYHYFVGKWDFPLTYPLIVEFPMSLAQAIAHYDQQLTSFVSRYLAPNFEYSYERSRGFYSDADLIALLLTYILVACEQLPALVALLTLYLFVHAEKNCQKAIDAVYHFRYENYHPGALCWKMSFMLANAVMISYVQIAIMENDYKRTWQDMNYVGNKIFIVYLLIGTLFVYFNQHVVYMDHRFAYALERHVTSGGSKEMHDKATDTDSIRFSPQLCDSLIIYVNKEENKNKEMQKAKKKAKVRVKS